MDHQPPAADAVLIRPMVPGDAEAVATLTGQLGYPAAPGEILARMAGISGKDDHLLLVAGPGGRAAAYIHAAVAMTLGGPPRVHVHSLVVEETARGTGLGAALLAAAEAWARSRGLAACSLYSQAKRASAHRFYLRHGYSEKKRSVYFAKDL